jgi:hypothetical protein
MPTEESSEGGEATRPKRAKRRANPSPPADLNSIVSALLSHPRLQPEFKTRETPADAEHRRKREFLSFIVKELSPFCLATLFMLAVGVYCFHELLNPKASPETQQRAWTAFTMLLSGVLGFVFGKTAGK